MNKVLAALLLIGFGYWLHSSSVHAQNGTHFYKVKASADGSALDSSSYGPIGGEVKGLSCVQSDSAPACYVVTQ
jgi:hypothetical protein